MGFERLGAVIATERTTAERRGVDLELVRRFASLARPYWLHEAGLWPWLGVLLIVAASIASPYLNVFKADYLRDQTNAMVAYRRAAFYVTIGLSFGNEIVMAFLASSASYVGGRVAVAWRAALSRQISGLYFRRRAYYVFQCNPLLDNPDERIGEDIRLSTASTVDMLTFAITFLSGLFAFSGITWAGIGWWSLLLIAYSLSGSTLIASRFGVLADLNAGRLRIEANFRYGLVRVREHAESIAFLRGEGRELTTLRSLFGAVAANTKDILLRTAQFKFAQILFGLGLSILPTVYITSRYFAHQIDLGTIGQLQFAVGASIVTLTSFVSSFSQISLWAAQINRLYEMRERLRENDRSEARDATSRTSLDGEVALTASDIEDPSGRLLVGDLSFDLGPRTSLVVTGPNGCGKSSLLRVLAGLWDARHEALTLPPVACIMFVSQKPYMPLGDLRVQLSYPHDPGAVDDDAYGDVLRTVGLSRLLEEPEGLDAARDWAGDLSLGEQQLVAIARVLLANPELALLDEATSALDLHSERRCYRALRDRGITLVSVAHRPELITLHDLHLELGLPNAAWRLTRTATAHG